MCCTLALYPPRSDAFPREVKQVVLETLSITEWVLVAFSVLIAVMVGAWLFKRLEEKPYEAGVGIRSIVGVITTLGIGLIISGLLVAPIGQAVGLRVPPEVPPPVVPEVQNVGYVQVVVIDQYKIPETAIQSARIQVTLSEPEKAKAIIDVAEDNSNTDGSALISVDGITSGTVWVVASKSGYYADVESTSIPGAQVYPTSNLWAEPELAKVGTLSLTVTDNTAVWDSTTNTITENLTTSLAHYWTLNLTVTTSYEALRDMQLAFIRGSDWENLGVSPIVVSVVDDADTSIATVGDITLSVDISAELNAIGDLDYSVTLKIKVKTNATYAFTGKEVLRIVINDIEGGVGYAGVTGISAVEIKVQTVI